MHPKYYLLFASVIGATTATILIRDFLIPKAKGDWFKLLQLLAIVHSFRFVGLSMFVPGISSPNMPAQFSIPAAWGDYCAAILALTTYTLLRRKSKFAVASAWIFNIWGFLDLVYAAYQAAILEVSNYMGVMFYIFAFYAPVLVVSHIVIFKALIRRG
ncbi:hypothetical protein CH373_03910 [Leptospira perolatii]|uniref:EXPERA domain-containing protein n=1 Tax=Leptospira perolatii TaxID=2023191 RepID=A0A2M9ZQ78_9LEPT|nr:hypothetical protein [Leptospira perolatii]PJZ69048.1 hypothetical protein CH360_13420 [Leptospira perolatii]PJZ74083.1 hypothetical protein CH373_03910 [Leptospira perolatii]